MLTRPMLAELASHMQPLLLLVLFSKSPMVVMTANQALVQLASTPCHRRR